MARESVRHCELRKSYSIIYGTDGKSQSPFKCHGVVLCSVVLLATIISSTAVDGRHVKQKRVIIHVPLKIRTHVHTHTVYTHVHRRPHGGSSEGGGGGGGRKQTLYKILGYTTHDGSGRGDRSHSHSHSHSHGHSQSNGYGPGGDYDRSVIDYDDIHSWDDQGNGVMMEMPNHLSLNESLRPDVDEFVDDQGFEWE